MLKAAWALLRDSGRVLLETAPEDMDLDKICAHLLETRHVHDVHDLPLKLYCGACQSFGVTHEPGECAACRRLVPLKKGYRRLCWMQASLEAKGQVTVLEPFLRKDGGSTGPAPSRRHPAPSLAGSSSSSSTPGRTTPVRQAPPRRLRQPQAGQGTHHCPGHRRGPRMDPLGRQRRRSRPGHPAVQPCRR
jgi:hypothetical protein